MALKGPGSAGIPPANKYESVWNKRKETKQSLFPGPLSRTTSQKIDDRYWRMMPSGHFYGVRCLGTALCSEPRLAGFGPPRWPGEKRRRAAALQIRRILPRDCRPGIRSTMGCRVNAELQALRSAEDLGEEFADPLQMDPDFFLGSLPAEGRRNFAGLFQRA